MDEPFDTAGHLGAMSRAVRDEGRDGRPGRTVVLERTFETAIEDLWDAITSAERIPRWFLPISGDLRLGGRYQLEGHAGGEITACDVPHHVAMTWEFNGDVSWVDVRLTEVDDGTHLVLEHAARVTPEWEERGFGPGAVGIGWEMMLLGLAHHVPSGRAIDPPEAMAWQSSEEAKAFMRVSSDAWCAADIAGGTPADVARAAADRTIEAYTADG